MRSRGDAALRDDHPVSRCRCDEIEGGPAIDRERLEIAGIDADHLGAEADGPLQLARLVCLDEGVEPERRCVREQRRSPPVVEIPQEQKDGVGARFLQFVELGLLPEESLRQERQHGCRARRAQIVDRASKAFVD